MGAKSRAGTGDRPARRSHGARCAQPPRCRCPSSRMPGSANSVMFITLEDEETNANLIVWPSVFEQSRRAILGASFFSCRGKVQKANGVTNLIVEQVTDLSADLKRVSGLDTAFPMVSGRGD